VKAKEDHEREVSARVYAQAQESYALSSTVSGNLHPADGQKSMYRTQSNATMNKTGMHTRSHFGLPVIDFSHVE